MSFSKNIVITEFFANRNEIAAKYCVNKNKPLLHCNGHCFLMKALHKEEDREKQLGDVFSRVELFVCGSETPTFSNPFPNLEESDTKIYCTYIDSFHLQETILLDLKPPIA